jgi:hypothetical protein
MIEQAFIFFNFFFFNTGHPITQCMLNVYAISFSDYSTPAIRSSSTVVTIDHNVFGGTVSSKLYCLTVSVKQCGLFNINRICNTVLSNNRFVSKAKSGRAHIETRWRSAAWFSAVYWNVLGHIGKQGRAEQNCARATQFPAHVPHAFGIFSSYAGLTYTSFNHF